MTNAVFPQTIFTTQRRFNDYGADDMRCGDLSESILKKELRLTNISNIVDPYTLTRLTVFDNPQSRFAGVYGGDRRGEQVSTQECARLLFEEMQVTSLPYAFVGPYKDLINQMLRHFQRSTGTPFSDLHLSAAYRNQILSDKSSNSSRMAIQQELNDHIDYSAYGYPQNRIPELRGLLKTRILPKFDSLIYDKINGMGITVHDVHATRIDILSLDVGETGWRARVKFTGQDHFGLDVNDIRKQKFSQFQFFKIWFILQRFNEFGFRPFMTNMEAIIDLQGKR